MKSTILLFLLVFVSVALFAQNGIGFQGIARDPQGNAIANQTISVKFTIGTFTETQNIASDDFGVFSATIGSVNTVGFNNVVFANITDNLKVEVDGTVIYDDKFNMVPYAKSAENGVPAGAIMPYAGTVTSGSALQEPIPGWLVCNGATLGTDAKYAKIKLVLGSLWGTNMLPDLRGTFLRGVNNGRTGTYADPANRTVGNFQDDDNKSHGHAITDPGHIHAITDPGHTHWMYYSNTGGSGAIDDASDAWKGQQQTSSNSKTGITINNNATGITINNSGTESRPKNAGIVYIIKY